MNERLFLIILMKYYLSKEILLLFFFNVSIDFDFSTTRTKHGTRSLPKFLQRSYIHQGPLIRRNVRLLETYAPLHFLETNKEAYRSSYEDSILFDLHFCTSFSFVNRPVNEHTVTGQSKLLGVHVRDTYDSVVERSFRGYSCSNGQIRIIVAAINGE